MNLPKTILIMGDKYKVVQDKRKLVDQGAYGELDYEKRTIFLNDEKPDREVIICFYHECLHAVMRRNGVAFSGALAPEIEEIIVETCAGFIYDTFYK